jgi:hypothetical protein
MSDVVVDRLKALADSLRDIRNARQSTSPNAAPASRARAAFALQHVADFLEGFKQFRDEGLAEPLWWLSLALADLEAGVVVDLLKPASRNGAPPMSSYMQTIMGMAAIGMDMLVHFRNDAPKDASKKVAKVLTGSGFRLPARGNRKPLPDVITDWRYRLRTGPGGAPPFAVRQWMIYQTMIREEIDSVDVDGWLKRLSNTVTFHNSD